MFDGTGALRQREWKNTRLPLVSDALRPLIVLDDHPKRSGGPLDKGHGSGAGEEWAPPVRLRRWGVVVESRTVTRSTSRLSDRKTVTLRLSRLQRRGTGGGPFLPRHTGQLDRLGIVVQIGHQCPAVKVERPTDERP
jgi:hypothetical protein